MSSDHFSQVRELFAEALVQPAASREAFVRERASDPAIAAEVLRLMGLDEQPQIHTLQGVQAMVDAEATPLAQGRRVGKFELFEVLGEGGMGQVYRARRVDGPEHWVAVKLMRRGLFNAASETRFLAEQQFLARLNHPNIAHYIDSGSDADGHVYVAMELVQGQRLLDFAKAKELNAKQRVTLFRQLLAAVSYAHRQLIIHRDLKQANVLVNPDGVVKLLDFGIAKLLQDQSQMTGTIERLYTPTCAAPEQIRGEPCDVTTDVYALGVLLYELIAGKSIFDTEGKTPGEFENLVLNVPPPDMKSRVHPELGCTDIPTDLERIVAKAIRKEPNRRYGSVEQLDADLERLLNNEPVSVSGNGFLYRAQKFLSRNKLASGLTTLIAIAVVSGLVITLQQNREIRAERDRANLALDAMKQAFLGADPGGEAGGEVTARQILERSSDSLIPLIKNGDDRLVDLASVLLEVQISMGLTADADKIYETLRVLPNVSNPRVCLLGARLRVEQWRLDEADTMLSACERGSAQLDLLYDVAKARLYSRRYQNLEAATLFRRIAENLDPNNTLWIYVVDQQIRTLSDAKLVDEAFEVLKRSQETAKNMFGANHQTLALLDVSRLRLLRSAGNFAEVANIGEHVLARIEHAFGANSRQVAIAEGLLASSLRKLGRHKEALRHFERVVAINSYALSPTHRDTLRSAFNAVLVKSEIEDEEAITEVRDRFEAVIVNSDRENLRAFRAYVQANYASWLSQKKLYTAALMSYLTIVDSDLQLLDLDERRRFSDRISDTYSRSDCFYGRTAEISSGHLCSILPRPSLLCFSVRQRICALPLLTTDPPQGYNQIIQLPMEGTYRYVKPSPL